MNIKDDVKEDIRSEVRIMKHFRHENIVRFFGATEDSVHVKLFMEFMEGTVPSFP